MKASGICPAATPPNPPVRLDSLQHLLEQANQSLGRLDGLASILPNLSLFIYAWVRKEAVLSSQIEGTQSSLSDLLLFENHEAPGVPPTTSKKSRTTSRPSISGLDRLRGGFPLSLRLIREIHEVLLSKGRGSDKQPGEFRRSQNWIGGTDRNPRLSFRRRPNSFPIAWVPSKCSCSRSGGRISPAHRGGARPCAIGIDPPVSRRQWPPGRLLIRFSCARRCPAGTDPLSQPLLQTAPRGILRSAGQSAVEGRLGSLAAILPGRRPRHRRAERFRRTPGSGASLRTTGAGLRHWADPPRPCCASLSTCSGTLSVSIPAAAETSVSPRPQSPNLSITCLGWECCAKSPAGSAIGSSHTHAYLTILSEGTEPIP